MNVQARAESHHEIVIQWSSPKRPNGEVTHYVIDGFREKDSPEFISQRNYCSERKPALVNFENVLLQLQFLPFIYKLPSFISHEE